MALGVASVLLTCVAVFTDAALQASEDGLKLYDCNLGFESGDWKKLWTPMWKEWCCQHDDQGHGCPPTSTATVTTTSETTVTVTTSTATTQTSTTTSRTSTTTPTTSTRTTTNLGCETNCTIKGVSVTCRDRMHWAKRDPRVLNSANSFPAGSPAWSNHVCKSSGRLVQSECSSCDVCSIDDFCEAEAMPAKCATACIVKGQSATCEARIKWAIMHDHMVKASKNPCMAAGESVQSQCPACGDCSLKWLCAKDEFASAMPASVDSVKVEPRKSHQTQLIHKPKSIEQPVVDDAMMPAKCAAACTLKGQSATCEDRMHWAMTHDSDILASASPCKMAGQIVQSQCSICNACSIDWACSNGKFATSASKALQTPIQKPAPKPWKYDPYNEDPYSSDDTSVILKFDDGHHSEGRLDDRVGFSTLTTSMFFVAFATLGFFSALVLARSRAINSKRTLSCVNEAMTDEDGEELENYADPLCPTSDGQGYYPELA